MAKPKSEKSAATKQFEKLKADLKTAKKKLAAQDNASNRSAVDKLVKELEPVTETVNRERFERVGNIRFQIALKGIKGLQAVANPRSYKFSKEDIETVILILNDELRLLKEKFDTALAGAGEKKTKAVTGNIFAKPTQEGKE